MSRYRSKDKCDIRSYYNRRAKLEFGEITACILYVRSDIGHILYIYLLHTSPAHCTFFNDA